MMDKAIARFFADLASDDRDLHNVAYNGLMEATEQPVDWAYGVWDELLGLLTHKDNHVRAIAAQVLCNLAKSDPEGRMVKDFGALLRVTRDERFVTARHCLQALWKVGAAGEAQQAVWLEGLTGRFEDCEEEKNCTLIRHDIIQSMRQVYDVRQDEAIRTRAQALIEREDDPKYRKKYAGLWRGG